MLVNRVGVRSTTRKRGLAALLTLALTGSTAVTVGASPAYAVGNIPFTGALCTAMENILFFNDDLVTSYTVYRGEHIRVDHYYGYDQSTAKGHGEGHSSRWFYWRHTTGTFRLDNCH